VVVKLLLELQTGMLALPLPSAFFFMMLFHDAVPAYAEKASGGWTAV
jgi:hypothetical protein